MKPYIKSLGDITSNVWDVKDNGNSMSFKSNEQYEERDCAFAIGDKRYDGWEIRPVSYNDFGGDYKHVASKRHHDENP